MAAWLGRMDAERGTQQWPGMSKPVPYGMIFLKGWGTEKLAWARNYTDCL